jgi:hypothetical protein
MTVSSDHFSRETAGLPAACTPQLFEQADGGCFDHKGEPITLYA